MVEDSPTRGEKAATVVVGPSFPATVLVVLATGEAVVEVLPAAVVGEAAAVVVEEEEEAVVVGATVVVDAAVVVVVVDEAVVVVVAATTVKVVWALLFLPRASTVWGPAEAPPGTVPL
ncbi:MAG TPA: hypothetical protein VJR05_08825 [Acidimicrobiia bacterium]|nr:hypothetical protein [Acidimicrobiia bacterium]